MNIDSTYLNLNINLFNSRLIVILIKFKLVDKFISNLIYQTFFNLKFILNKNKPSQIINVAIILSLPVPASLVLTTTGTTKFNPNAQLKRRRRTLNFNVFSLSLTAFFVSHHLSINHHFRPP